MADERKIWDDEETIGQEIVRDREEHEEYVKGKVKYRPLTNGQKPKNRLDLGRNCISCGGRMVIKEFREEPQTNLLRCTSCHREWFDTDVAKNSEISDKLYRTIPLSVQQYWIEYGKNRNK